MTSTAIDTNHATPVTALAIRPGQHAWDETQAAALAQIGLKDASDGDRAVFLHHCQRTGLDPFARQVYMIPRNEKVPGTRDQWRVKWTIQTGIDGWRVIRDRAERREGVRGTLSRPLWYDDDGTEHKVWVRPDAPAACELTYTLKGRDGTETPYTSVLQFREYAQCGNDGKLIAQWAVKKSHMLEKCVEADVYRKAFPQDFSGLDLDGATMQDAPDAGQAPDGRPRGRVTAGEIVGRGTPATGDDTLPGPGHAVATEQDRAGNGQRTRTDPRAAGAASPRGAQPPPPQDQPGDHPGSDGNEQLASARKEQLAQLDAILAGLGFGEDDAEQKRTIAEVITGRALIGPRKGRSAANLSAAEATRLIAKLNEFVDGDGERDRAALIAWLAEHEQDGTP